MHGATCLATATRNGNFHPREPYCRELAFEWIFHLLQSFSTSG
jgi:hypothetical protein